MEELTLSMSYSKKSCINTCRKKAYFKYKCELEAKAGSSALRYGRVFHSAMNGYYKVIKSKGWSAKDEAITAGSEQAKRIWDKVSAASSFREDDYRTYSVCMQAFLNYLTFYEADSTYLDVISTERRGEIVLVPETELEKRTFGHLPPLIYKYVIDLIVNLGGMAWVLDFKTTGSYIDSVAQKLERSDQLIGYVNVTKALVDLPIEGCLASIVHTSARKSTKEGGGYGVPKIEFRRVPQLFTEGDFRDWRLSTFSTAKELFDCSNLDLWPANYDHCFDFKACEYFELCSQHKPAGELELGNYRKRVYDMDEEEEEVAT